MVFALLVFECTKSSYTPGTLQGSQKGKILVVAQARLGNQVVLEVWVVVEDYEVPKYPLHQLDLFEVDLILVVVVVDPFYKEKEYSIFKNRIYIA